MIYKMFGIALLVLSSFSIAFAQDRQMPPALISLVETEKEFSRASEREGMSTAFLEYFEKGGLAFVPEPVPVEAVFGGEETAKRLSRFKLIWQPIYGDVSAAEDYGYITGISARTDQQNPSAPARYGAFFSFWKKQPDGAWKVMLDCGARTPQAFAARDASFAASPNRGGKRRFYNADDSEIQNLERRFYEDLQRRGSVKAYLSVANEYSRLHRMDQMPHVGKEALGAFLASQTAKANLTLNKTGISKSGDLGFAYGNYETLNGEKGAKSEKGVFFRVWQRDPKGAWKLVVDVMKGSSE